jgi:integrase/recombinase XerD
MSQANNSMASQMISDYISNISMMNELTAKEYCARLRTFELFIEKKYSQRVEDIISKIKHGKQDPYSLLTDFAQYLNQQKISALTLKQRVVTVKNFLEYHDIDISPRRFKLKVKLPRIVRKNKEALSKEDIVEILNAASDIRIKTYVLLLAATGMRAGEALSVRIKDLDLDSSPARLFVRGQYTKTKTDRTIFLADEAAHQLKSWLDYKYRTRRVCYKDQQGGGRTISEYRSPTKNDSDLVFAVYQDKERPNYLWLYNDLVKSFQMTLDRNGKGAREDGNERRRQITLHSFRRYVKTTISDLGYADYSDYFIGHSGSTYWRKKDSEKAEIFRKIEPYLTFLNIHQLERQGADIQTKVEELEELNQSLRQRDKVKDDAIAQLSDQLVSLSARLQEIERRQDDGAREVML